MIPVSPARLPTNTTTHRHAVHRWFSFIAGFSPELVAACCPPAPGATLLDPFAGCGTSLVVGQELGHRTLGFEPHPFFARIARAKTQPAPGPERLARIESVLVEGLDARRAAPELTVSARSFLEKLFDPGPLRRLLGARAALEQAGLAEDDLAFLLLSRVLDMCSKAQTDGIYKAPTSAKRAEEPRAAIEAVLDQVRADVRERGRRLPPSRVELASSESMASVASGSVDVVVTSPPYLNNFDFAEMTRMYLYFWGMCGSWREITEGVRSRLVVNTTTALAGHRDKQEGYRAEVGPGLHPVLDAIVAALAMERRRRAGRKEYDLLVYPYFAQMIRVLREIRRCLRGGGAAHLVVADAAFYGVHVSTPQLLASALSDLGFASVRCEKLRDRGHRWVLDKRDGSPVGLGEYHLVATAPLRRSAP